MNNKGKKNKIITNAEELSIGTKIYENIDGKWTPYMIISSKEYQGVSFVGLSEKISPEINFQRIIEIEDILNNDKFRIEETAKYSDVKKEAESIDIISDILSKKYKILDGDHNTIYVKSKATGKELEINITELDDEVLNNR